MADIDFLDSARREEARLVRRLAAIRTLIADYSGAEPLPRHGLGVIGASDNRQPAVPTQTRQPRSNSNGSEIGRIAEAFLTAKGARADSTEITEEVLCQGVPVGGVNKGKVVSSYLSSSDKFDNIRGQGYGLRIWSQNQTHKENEPSSGDAVGSDAGT